MGPPVRVDVRRPPEMKRPEEVTDSHEAVLLILVTQLLIAIQDAADLDDLRNRTGEIVELHGLES